MLIFIADSGSPKSSIRTSYSAADRSATRAKDRITPYLVSRPSLSALNRSLIGGDCKETGTNYSARVAHATWNRSKTSECGLRDLEVTIAWKLEPLMMSGNPGTCNRTAARTDLLRAHFWNVVVILLIAG